MTDRASITILAAENHIARSVALQYLKDAGVPRWTDKTFDYARATEALRARIDNARVIGNRAAGRAGGILGDAVRIEHAEAKADSERMRARKMRLQLEQLEDKLVDRETVAEVCKDIATRARSAFLSIAPKLAPRLAGMTDERAIAKLIEEEARLALGALADPWQFTNEALS